MVPSDQHPWGRADENGVVYVRVGDGERTVGQYPDAGPEEAIAYFERKYSDLEGQVSLLELRVRRGTPPASIAKSVETLTKTVATANAVGDLAALTQRLEALAGTVSERAEQHKAEQHAAQEQAVKDRVAIVEAVEALAAKDLERAQWKQVSTELNDLFTRWQQQQQHGPQLPKATADELWQRFRTARATIEQHRRAFFTKLDASNKVVRSQKQEIIERAEALASQGAAGIPAYRSLIDEWKNSGRAGKKQDDALWERFKAAGDVLFAAKAEADAKEDEEFSANLTKKLALLTEAEALLEEKDPAKARAALANIQRSWDEAGKVPRDQVRTIEARLRKVESSVRALESDHWERTNPEKKARSEGMVGQLEAAIEELEAQLAAAKERGDTRAASETQEALDARRAWLKVVSG